MTTPDPFAPAKQIQELARVADMASVQIFELLVQDPNNPNAELLRRMMRELDRAAAQLDAQALQMMGAINEDSLVAIKAATSTAEAFAAKTADIMKGLKVFASILNLAGSLVSGAGVLVVIDAANAVGKAAKPENKVAAGASLKIIARKKNLK